MPAHSFIAPIATTVVVAMSLPGFISCQGAETNVAASLTNAQQVLGLSHVEARQLRPVNLRGVVTYFAPERSWFWVQDASGAVLVSPSRPMSLTEGQTVELNGVTDSGLFTPWVVEARIQVTGATPLPAPIKASPGRMTAGEHHGYLVEVEGSIRDVSRSYQNLILLASSQQTRFRVILHSQDRFTKSLPSHWLDARVRVRGLCWTDYDTAGNPGGFSIRLSKTNDLEFLASGSSNLFDRPLVDVRAIDRNDSNTRVRIRGTVAARLPGGTLFLQDATGALEARPLLPLPRVDLAGLHLDLPPAVGVQPGDEVELIGAPNSAAGSPQLSDCVYRVVGRNHPAPPSVATTSELFGGGNLCRLITVRGRLLHRESRPAGRYLHESLLMEQGGSRFEAILETERSTNQLHIPPNSLVELTGLATLAEVGIQREPQLKLWLRETSEARVMGQWSEPACNLGRVVGVLALVIVISAGGIAFLRQRLKAQERLMARLTESENRFRLLFERFNDPIMLLDLKTFKFIDCNQATVDQMRCGTKEAFCSRAPWEISPERQPDGLSSRDKAEAMIGTIHEKGYHRFEWLHVRADGSEFPVEVSLSAVQIGERPLLVTIWRDITERKRAEEEIRQLNLGLERRVAERTTELRASEARLSVMVQHEKQLNELKTNFVSMVSHEFRTPLGVILVASEVLLRYFERLDSAERADHLRDIVTSVKRMAGMMEDVLLLSRVEAGRLQVNPSELNVRLFCRRIIDEVHSATHRPGVIQMHCDVAVPGTGMGDENLVRHVLTNLLTNAVKYSPADRPVELRLRGEGASAVFEIVDQGIGIPHADQERLFQTFHRGRNVGQITGTGLGLVIVKRCCDLLGGAISVSSTEGQGTMFTVRIPMFEPDRSASLST